MLKGTEDWIPDELQHAGRENRSADHAARYDQKEDAAAAEEVALLLPRLGPDAVVIDLGAGTGQFSAAASRAVRHVTAVDVSPVMLRQLESKLTRLEVRNVDCRVAGFLTYVHEGPPADLVYSRYALHHLPDFWKALALCRMASFLRPGGLLRLWDVVYAFDSVTAPEHLEQWIATVAPSAGDDRWNRADLVEHVRDEHSTFNWLLEPMIEKAGFTIETVEYSPDRIFAKYVCVRNDRLPTRPNSAGTRYSKFR